MNLERTANIKKSIFIGLLFLMFAFVVFVLVRNDWAVDMNDLSGAVKKALGTRTVAEQQASLLAQLDVTPNEVYKQRLKDGKLVTVVSGDIQNKSRYPMEKVMVEGRLRDATGKVHLTTAPVPCAHTATKKELSQLTTKQLKQFYIKGGQPVNCIILSDYAIPFMVFFEKLPPEFNATFEFEVHPHSGQFSE